MNILSYISNITYKPIISYILDLTKKNIFSSNLLHLILQKYDFSIDYDYCEFDKRYIKLTSFYYGTIEINSYLEEKNIESIKVIYSYYFTLETIEYNGTTYFNFNE